MIKNTLLVVLLCVIAIGLASTGLAQASSHVSVTRSISPSSVPAGGGEVTVTVRINGAYGGIGSVKETLPAGFTYVDGSVTLSDVTPERDGQKWSFPLVGGTSFSYKVNTSSTAGQHPFSGKFTYGVDKTTVDVVGTSSVTVEEAQQSSVRVTRSISPSSVPAGGGEVTVTVRINGAYGGIGSVKETLPAGFTYVDGSVTLSDVTPERDGQKWSFPLVGGTSFSYKVNTSSTAGQHPFSGKFTYGVDKTTVDVVGTSSVTVEEAQQSSVRVTRSISPSSVPAGGGEVTVTVRINGAYGGIGSVKETLPAGFTYVDGSVTLSDVTPERDGQKWSFPLVGGTSFSYKVNTSSTAGQHPFSGKFTYGVDKTTVDVVGESSVTVRTPPPPPPRRPPPPVPAPNVEEMGEVTLSASATEPLTMAPQAGDTITGAVMDPDGGVIGETWQWSRTMDDMDSRDMDSWVDIEDATDDEYTVMEGDTGYYLRVMATYTDAVGTDTAMEYSMPTMMVGAEAGDPLFGYDTSGNGRIDKDELAKAVFDYEINLTLKKPALADLVFSYEIGL